MYKQATISVFLDFKGAFDSVNRQVLFNILVQKGVPIKFVNIIQSMYSRNLWAGESLWKIVQNVSNEKWCSTRMPTLTFLV